MPRSGAIIGQALVAASSASGRSRGRDWRLLGAGSLYLTQVSAGGSYFGDIFLGLLICGPGVGLTFVTLDRRARRRAEREAGLASGLSNTTFQIGAALGDAVVSTVAFSRTAEVLAAGGDQALALTEGFQSAFAACIALTAAGALIALATLGKPRSVPSVDALEPIPQPARD